MKLLTVAIPCYNSQDYMKRCIDSLLVCKEEGEIIIVDDGSTDRTGEIADEYAKEYPDIVKVIHKENGGHGSGVNAGLEAATGTYFKVVDSDDWLDEESLKELLSELREWEWQEKEVDLVVCNYVYDHLYENKTKPMRYTNVFPEKKLCTWNDMGNFKPSQYLVMHALLYRTQILRDCRLQLPKHTFYVDNIFAYKPLPYVKNICYLNLDLYHYFLGRDDQSVNEKVLMKRIDQQIKVTKLVSDCVNLGEVSKTYPKLAAYMTRNISIMMAISSIHLLLIGDKEAYAKRENLWEHIKALHPKLYSILKYRRLSGFTYLPGGTAGGFVTLTGYRLARKMYQFQ